MKPERLAELRALAKAASAGPWKQSFVWYNIGDRDARIKIHTEGVVHESAKRGQLAPGGVIAACGLRDCRQSIDDGKFIASTRTAMVECLDEIERLRAQVRTVDKQRIRTLRSVLSSTQYPSMTLGKLQSDLLDMIEAHTQELNDGKKKEEATDNPGRR